MQGVPSVEFQRRRAQSLADSGHLKEALATLLTAAADLRTANPEGAAILLIDAVQAGLMIDGPDRALTIAADAVQLSQGTATSTAARALIRWGDALTWVGRHAEAAAAWQHATEFPSGSDPSFACERANAALRGGKLMLARDLAYEAVVRARDAESHEDLLDALNITAMTEIHVGHLREALDLAEQGLDLTRDEGDTPYLDAIGLAAWVTALLGDTAYCQQLLEQAAEMSAELRMTAPGGLAKGMLALSQGRYPDAARAFESKSVEVPMDPVAQALGLRPYVPAQVEAYARAGQTDQARSLLATFLDAALATGQPRHAAPALRAKGVSNDALEAFDQALRAHEMWGNRFEEARTLLARGEILRRQGRREAARADLRAAAERFEQVGAMGWRDRAVSELRAAGDRSVAVPTARGRGPEELTQQEAAVAALVVKGLSNREIADRLFLSVKTVEGHLTTIYGKLGLTSRAQLIASGIGPSHGGSTG
jgi:DNA-binding CsgD family transcriptional regulator